MRIAVLIKQVPQADALALGSDGRLIREGLELQMNAYCRRAISKGIELARATSGSCVAITLGPPAAEDVLREAVAGGADEGILVSDPAFAGSDTLATAKTMAAMLSCLGTFDLILVGRNSVDADTGQVGPAVAELLDLPFVGSARNLDISGNRLKARSEREDGWVTVEVDLPAVVSAAERLCRPLSVGLDDRRSVAESRIKKISAGDLGPGPWGKEASPTRVGPTRLLETSRLRRQFTGSLEEQVRQACALLIERGAFGASMVQQRSVPQRQPGPGPVILVTPEPGEGRSTRELAGAAACLAHDMKGSVTAFASGELDARQIGSWGVDNFVCCEGVDSEEDFARSCADWVAANRPWAMLSPSTLWGREIAARVAARLGAGLTGDAIGMELENDRLIAWKPAFGGRLVAAITSDSDVQMVTLRPGALPLIEPRIADAAVTRVAGSKRSRVRILQRHREDTVNGLAAAVTVVGVGTGVPVDEYERVQPLLDCLGAELAATRKVTDLGWLARSRQVGLTGLSISPRLYIAIGLSGNINHSVGIRRAGTVLAINTDQKAGILKQADVSIIADWREVVPILCAELSKTLKDAKGDHAGNRMHGDEVRVLSA
ncbi:MAG: hypothetical protein QOK29_1973 [Rhodospirillaceae bacterium]|nr:hypothetical protein [Rhodospirillaceae bacterium]